MGKYQAPLDSQKNSSYKKRGEVDDSCLPQEVSISDHELSAMRTQLEKKT